MRAEPCRTVPQRAEGMVSLVPEPWVSAMVAQISAQGGVMHAAQFVPLLGTLPGGSVGLQSIKRVNGLRKYCDLSFWFEYILDPAVAGPGKIVLRSR